MRLQDRTEAAGLQTFGADAGRCWFVRAVSPARRTMAVEHDLIERAAPARPGVGRRGVTLMALLLAAGLAFAGCGKSSTSTTSGSGANTPATTGSVSGSGTTP